VGFTFDQTDVKTELRWYVGGAKHEKPTRSKKVSDAYPAFSVKDGAEIEVKFLNVQGPAGFDELIYAIDML